MRTMKSMRWLCVGVALLSTRTADAQVPSPATEKVFVNVNFGGQLAPRTVASTSTKEIYGEPATVSATHPVNRGAIIDLAAGYRVWGDVYVAISASRFEDSADGTYAAKVPDPVVFDLFKNTTGATTGLNRTETAINPHAIWVLTLTDKIDLALGIGASLIELKQQVVSDFEVPLGTQSVIPVLVQENGTAKGVYASVDFIYNLMQHYGVGGFVRYAGGKVDLPSVKSHNVGGMQAGGGIRLRF